MHATVRRYDRVTNPQDATERVQGGFAPLISAMAGFVAYYWVDLGYGAMLSVSIFNHHSIDADQSATRWIKANLASLLVHDPRTEAGEVVAHKSMAMAGAQRVTIPFAGGPPVAARSVAVDERAAQRLKPHLTLRRYEGVTNPLEAAKQIRESFVPVISALPGFSAYYWVDVGHAAMLSVSVFDSFAHGVESGQTAAVWVRANLAEVLPQNPRIEAGRVVATV
jgi:hypothetical protein